MPSEQAIASIDALAAALQAEGYFADRRLATAVFLALRLQRPLLLEG
ncbi:MAG: ATPase, partial [Delftia sp.]|nr:ATPase [Delftia sp.]